jgi:hypothetical protein
MGFPVHNSRIDPGKLGEKIKKITKSKEQKLQKHQVSISSKAHKTKKNDSLLDSLTMASLPPIRKHTSKLDGFKNGVKEQTSGKSMIEGKEAKNHTDWYSQSEELALSPRNQNHNKSQTQNEFRLDNPKTQKIQRMQIHLHSENCAKASATHSIMEASHTPNSIMSENHYTPNRNYKSTTNQKATHTRMVNSQKSNILLKQKKKPTTNDKHAKGSVREMGLNLKTEITHSKTSDIEKTNNRNKKVESTSTCTCGFESEISKRKKKRTGDLGKDDLERNVRKKSENTESEHKHKKKHSHQNYKHNDFHDYNKYQEFLFNDFHHFNHLTHLNQLTNYHNNNSNLNNHIHNLNNFYTSNNNPPFIPYQITQINQLHHSQVFPHSPPFKNEVCRERDKEKSIVNSKKSKLICFLFILFIVKVLSVRVGEIIIRVIL